MTLLGTGTLVPHARRRPPALHIAHGTASILFDCGAGVLQGFAETGVGWSRLTHVVFSHYHTDHTGGLASLLWALAHGVAPSRTRPLTVLGPPGLQRLRRGLALAHGAFVDGGTFPVTWREVAPGGRVPLTPSPDRADRGGHLTARATPHTDTSVAWRLDTVAGAVGYTGDTGPDPALGDFFSGCALVVSECSAPASERRPGHLTPPDVAALARRARPGEVVVTHVYPPHDPDVLAARAEAAADGVPVRAGRDGERLRFER